MEPLGPVADAALAALLARAPLTPQKVQFAWRLAVGDAIDRVTTATLHEGQLQVTVAAPAWEKEVTRAERLILGRLRRLLGPDVVRALTVRVGMLSREQV